MRAEPSRDFDVLHYRIELRFDEETKSLWGKTTIRMSAFRDGLATIALDAETFTVDRVEDESSRELAFTHTNGRLAIELARPARHAEEFSLTVHYSGTGIDVDPERFGMSKGYDLGLDFKDETAEHPRLINTLSFPEGARHWFPSHDHPHDRATQETIATVGEDYKVLSNGRLVEVRDGPDPGTRTWHWSQERPHPTYLFVLVAGPYVVLKDSVGNLPLHYWIYEKDRDDAMRSFEKTKAIIRFFEGEYGVAFPWVKYDQVTIPGIGGGAESTSATVLGESTIHDARAEQDFPSHGLVAHEAAHQWWGNLVSYRDWSETWMSESFATYGEYLFSRHDLGDDEGAVNLLAKKEAYLGEARERYRRPIVSRRWERPNDNFDRHTYQKGAVVLHMLRFVLGEAPFRAAVQHFLETHAFQPVDTHDFIDSIQEATGQNLEWFFDQWIYRAGHPVFDVSFQWSEQTRKLSLRIRQTGDFFRTPVQIGVHTASGHKSVELWLEEPDAEFELDASERPLLVRFDEGNHLLKEWSFAKSFEELSYQLRNDDVIGRMWAASELGKHGANAHAVLAEAARRDPFWSVRRAAVEAGEPLVELLKEKALDANSKVRVAALRRLGDSRRADLVPFLQERFRLDDSYLAQAEALRALGKTGGASVRPFLEDAARLRSPRDVIGEAARAALDP
jgi:aminopeptidase N